MKSVNASSRRYICRASSLDGSSTHSTAGNTSASGIITRTYDQALVDCQYLPQQTGAILVQEHKAPRYELNFTLKMGAKRVAWSTIWTPGSDEEMAPKAAHHS